MSWARQDAQTPVVMLLMVAQGLHLLLVQHDCFGRSRPMCVCILYYSCHESVAGVQWLQLILLCLDATKMAVTYLLMIYPC